MTGGGGSDEFEFYLPLLGKHLGTDTITDYERAVDKVLVTHAFKNNVVFKDHPDDGTLVEIDGLANFHVKNLDDFNINDITFV